MLRPAEYVHHFHRFADFSERREASFTGNFALTMMLEPAMLAPVLCQPSLPLNAPGGIETHPHHSDGFHGKDFLDCFRLVHSKCVNVFKCLRV